MFSKRGFLKSVGAATVGFGAVSSLSAAPESQKQTAQKDHNLTRSMTPISAQERLDRIAKAQRLMQQNGLAAILLEPGSAMLYFSGIRWWRSERLTAVIIPAEGDIAVVTPYFEEPSVRESMAFGDDVRTWHEHESPFARVAEVLRDRGFEGGTIGLEDTVRYFVVDGLQAESVNVSVGSARVVTQGCRMYKTEHELTLMHCANTVTLAAYGDVWDQLEAGMTPEDVNQMMRAAQAKYGGAGIWTMALLAEASAYPHGTSQPQSLKNGDIVLMDCGCSVHGYQSDISRTFVFGEPTKKQRDVWATVRKGQDIAFEAAHVGAAAGTVDDAVRRYYESLGYGPGYKTPGLSHRTGHGIGMDGHEPVNFVHNEQTPLAAGMCFSNEPGIYIFDEFGVRLEDCLYMTDNGPEWFTSPPESLEKPIGNVGKVPTL